MRAWKKEPEEQLRERYLGEIAPLLEAARQVEMLSPVEKKQVRKRILRTLFGTRFLGLRGRLVPVLVALALLVFGGAAFATAQRLGLLPRLGGPSDDVPAPASSSQVGKHKGTHGRPGARPAANAEVPSAVSTEAPAAAPLPAETPTVMMPTVPDPLLVPASAPVWVWSSPERTAPSSPAAAPASAATVAARKPTGRPGSLLAMSAPSSMPAASMGPAAPVIPAPPDEPAVPVPAPSPASAAAAPALAPAPVAAPVQPPASLIPATVAPAAPPAPAAPAAGAPPPAPATKATKPASPDQALFGQALRKLRSDNDPAEALATLREHAQAFPKSALAGERLALEVEALLALHRDRDALALLDIMALDELPRSGERLVVRGELRAAAQRWREANADFDRALSRVSGSPSWHERALWGRGVSRLRSGDREGGLMDIERYREAYPRGRFAVEAAKFAPGQ
jgi:hypothetical protein